MIFNQTIHKIWPGLTLVLLGFFAASAAAEADQPVCSFLSGTVVETGSGEPIGFTNILLPELNRSVTSNENGTFFLEGLAPGDVTLKTFRIGYKNVTLPLHLVECDTLQIVITLDRVPIHLGGVTVEASRTDQKSPVQPDILFSDKKLHQNLGLTIAETIDYEPGISQRSMGPAPARPVLRGLGGDRLLLLEDQEQTGDLSATSTDHAVVIEPMTAERIEVVRGPEALVYGSNTLGGVVNVIRGYVPSRRLSKVSGTASLQGETVNGGYATGIELSAPLGPFMLRGDGSFRQASDMRTPLGTLVNTKIHTANGSLGASWVQNWGYAGGAFSSYASDYGIPPDPNGGHPSGVDISLSRKHYEAKAEVLPKWPGIRRLELRYNHSVYYHQELEKNGSLGMEYGVVSDYINASAFLKSSALLKNGIVGVRAGSRDFASGGLTFTPNTFESHLAAFYYQELHWQTFLLHGALRYDRNRIDPQEQRYSTKVGFIRKRSLNDVSASLSPHWLLNSHFTLGASVMRTFRAPTTEELFSEGPHLAAYSYQVGNANLKKENGLGLELFLEYKFQEAFIHLALFQNDIRNYTFPQNTGERSWRRADLFVYQFVGEHALMRGAELSYHMPIVPHVHSAGSLSYVWGELVDVARPIPYMPPLEGKLNVVYEINQLNIGATVRAADKQTRVGEFEQKTDGYVVFDVTAQYTLSTHRHLHSFSLSIENLTDTIYRKHLNRVREIMPEPGRNIRLLYKIFI